MDLDSGIAKFRILSLDGGRLGFSSIFSVLSALMNQISHTVEDDNIKICHDFDLIVGIAVGGVVTLLPGRLRLNMTQCIEPYSGIEQKIFRKTPQR